MTILTLLFYVKFWYSFLIQNDIKCLGIKVLHIFIFRNTNKRNTFYQQFHIELNVKIITIFDLEIIYITSAGISMFPGILGKSFLRVIYRESSNRCKKYNNTNNYIYVLLKKLFMCILLCILKSGSTQFFLKIEWNKLHLYNRLW